MPPRTHLLKTSRIVILAAVLLMSAPMLPETNIVKAGDNHPALWKFLYTPPVVSTFSGSATSNYPLEVPPGRGGIQPSVNFSYNNGRVNGMLGYLMIDGGPLGLGWSADQMDITRQIRQVFEHNQPTLGQRMSYRSPGVSLRIYYYRILPFSWQGTVESVMLLMDDVTEQIRLSEEVRRVERHLAPASASRAGAGQSAGSAERARGAPGAGNRDAAQRRGPGLFDHGARAPHVSQCILVQADGLRLQHRRGSLCSDACIDTNTDALSARGDGV